MAARTRKTPPISPDGDAASKPGLDRLASWFTTSGWYPFPFQREAWAAYLRGESGLVNVPTGAGKTYAAFGGPLAEMIDELGDRKRLPAAEAGLRVLYLTPLRAVSRDIELALRRPIDDMGLPFRVESRTGDTSSARRAKQRTAPPQVLVTTPESLSLLLTHDDSPEFFAGLRCLVLDEWHELMASKRGTQTELAAARLRRLSPSLRTWALSATLENLAEAARAAVGVSNTPPTLVRAAIHRQTEIDALVPQNESNLPWAGHMGLRMLPELLRHLDPSVSTLIFTNTRAQAELWHQAIAFARPDWADVLALHHGSIERADRERVEAGVKAGSIRLVVCTSSLDLGVDFAPVERVVQIGSPKGIARLLQRAGRSGHRPGEVSRILCVPTHQMELVEVAAVKRAVEEKRIEPRLPPLAPLDVLAQHMVTRALGTGFTADELYDEVRTAWSYRELSRRDFEWTLSLVREGAGTLRRYPEFNKIAVSTGERPGEAPFRGRYRITAPKLGQLHRMNLGTITMTSGQVDLRYWSGRRLGNIDESFIAMVEPGERFYFAGKMLELVRLDALEAVVKPAKGKTTRTPHWSGIRLPISESLASEIRSVLARRAAGEPLHGTEMAAAERFFRVQAAMSVVPREGETLVEILSTREGRHLFVFPFEGRSVHAGLAALLALRLARAKPATFTTAVNDYGLEILCPEPFPFEEHLSPALFTLDGLTDDVLASVNMSSLAKAQFREVARIAGLVFQTFPGARRSGRQVQASSSLIFDVLEQFDPGHLLLEQSRREVLERQFERSRLARTLTRLAQSRLAIAQPERPTPLSFPLVVERVGAKISTESLFDRITRMGAEWCGPPQRVEGPPRDKDGEP